MTIEAIIFDFDGTIVDTETPDFQSWHELFKAHGLELGLDRWRERVGKALGDPGTFEPAPYFEQLTGTPLSAETRRAQYENYMRLCNEQILLPGVTELFQQAKPAGIKLGMASNSDRRWIDKWVDHFDLRQYFECIFTRDDVTNAKPAPDMYLSAARCLNVSPERCIAIEDSPVGMTAANAAGMHCVAVPNYLTAHLERPVVALTLRTLADMQFSALLAHFQS